MNTHRKVTALSSPKKIKEDIPLIGQWAQVQKKATQEIRSILNGEDRRQVLIIGPCSADFEDSLLEYGKFLKELQEKVRNKLLLIMRFYTGKPRTVGGWKGMQQGQNGWEVNIEAGIREARSIAVQLLSMWIPLADEMLHPQLIGHLDDIYSYLAIGARSVENQFHREVASGAPMPVGFKNPTSGDLLVLANSIKAGQTPSDYVLANGAMYHSEGNPDSHGILRGQNIEWVVWSNYDLASIQRFLQFAQRVGLTHPRLLIDTNHDNSGKKPEKQIGIMQAVMNILKQHPEMRPIIKGFMVESYLNDGRQDATGNIIHGISLTDPCLGREGTEEFVRELADKI